MVSKGDERWVGGECQYSIYWPLTILTRSQSSSLVHIFLMKVPRVESSEWPGGKVEVIRPCVDNQLSVKRKVILHVILIVTA